MCVRALVRVRVDFGSCSNWILKDTHYREVVLCILHVSADGCFTNVYRHTASKSPATHLYGSHASKFICAHGMQLQGGQHFRRAALASASSSWSQVKLPVAGDA